jgi:hypothetical protein
VNFENAFTNVRRTPIARRANLVMLEDYAAVVAHVNSGPTSRTVPPSGGLSALPQVDTFARKQHKVRPVQNNDFDGQAVFVADIIHATTVRK